MTPRDRGQELRRAVNYSVRNNQVDYIETGRDNRWVAEVHYRIQRETTYTHSHEEWAGTENVYVCFEVYFTPDRLDYGGCHVYNEGYEYPVDWKTYRWAVRKLSEHQVMQRMVQS